jgi:hypothetical protein
VSSNILFLGLRQLGGDLFSPGWSLLTGCKEVSSLSLSKEYSLHIAEVIILAGGTRSFKSEPLYSIVDFQGYG